MPSQSPRRRSAQESRLIEAWGRFGNSDELRRIWSGRCVRLDAHTTKNGEARVLPFTANIETILKGQLAAHERLKATGTICRFVFHRDGEDHHLPQGVGRRV